MNKKEQLIADTLGHTDGEAFARHAAAQVRRRHALRKAGLAAGTAAALVAVLFVAQKPTSTRVLAPIASSPAFEVISDQELLAQLKDQPVLILRDQSQITGVVFLTEKPPKNL